MRIGHDGRLADLFVGGVLLAEPQVVGDRIVEQDGLLRHDAHILPQTFDVVLTNIHPVDQDRAALYVVKARDQIRKRRFASAGRTDQRNGLPFPYFEVNAANYLLIIVGKTHVAELDFVVQSGHPDCIGRIGDLAFLIEQRQHALPGRNPLVDVGERIGKRTQRPGDLRKDRQVGDERARLQIARQHQAAAVDHQHRRRGNHEKLARR